MDTYEQKYKEALERAKAMIKVAANQDEAIGFANTIFPELAESEDERILEIIKHCIESRYLYTSTIKGISQKQCFAWLEKQGNPNTEYWKGYKDGKKAILDRYSETHKIVEPKFNIGDWIVSDLDDVNEDFRLCKIIDIEDGCYTIQSDKDCKGYNFFEIWESDYHLWSIEDAKPGDVLAVDSMPFIYNGSKNEVTVGAYCGFNAKYRFSFAYNYVINQNITPATKEQRDLLFQKMNEAGYEWDAENKQLKKIGPKFKVDDWVVHDMSDGRKVIRQIINMTNKSYILDGEDFNIFYFNDLENDYHLWTIQDAKPGDVLAFDDETIVIFKDLYNATTFHSYCHIEDGLFDVNKDEMPDWWEGKGFHPATKKQRDILFQKMKEEGYEWFAGLRELRKLPTPADVGFVEFGKAWEEEAKDKKPTWSEEDEKMLDDAIGAVGAADYYTYDDKVEIERWLKSLKQRIGG